MLHEHPRALGRRRPRCLRAPHQQRLNKPEPRPRLHSNDRGPQLEGILAMHHINTAAATMPLALQAVANHMVDQHLPAPQNITLRYDDGCIQVHITPEQLVPWLTSGFHDDTENVTRFPHLKCAAEHVRVDVEGRLPSPIGDVAVRLSYFRRAQQPVLRAVAQ